jgi:5'-deoxynucleotidase YfbR-like HD superfamily hydrolase
MTRDHILALPPQGLLNLARQIRYGYHLKRTTRYATKRDRKSHSESVAEHIFALHYLNYFFLPLEDPKRTLDQFRIHRMIMFHDFGEIPSGLTNGQDVPYHIKTAAHEEQERSDAQHVFSVLPPSLSDEARLGWSEYELRESREARYVYALDKLEPQFELFDPIAEKSLPRLNFTYEHHIGKKYAAMGEDFPVMRRFVEVMSEDMLNRDVFWRAPRKAALA